MDHRSSPPNRVSDRRRNRPPPPRPLGARDADAAAGDPGDDGVGPRDEVQRADSEGRDRSPSKPTSVWDVVGDARQPMEEVEFPGREIEVDGEAWWVQELGRTSTGRAEDAGATLVLVGFRRGGEGSEEGAWVREAWMRTSSLEALSELELADLLEGAGPFRPIPDEPGPFFGPRTRPGRSGGRRGRR